MTAKKARIGDIVEIKTPFGLRYIQFTHAGGTEGELVRILPGLFQRRPLDFPELAVQKEMYFVFFILNHSFHNRRIAAQMDIVSNQPVPEWAKSPPMMRHVVDRDVDGKPILWRIVSATTKLTLENLQHAHSVAHLSSDEEKMSIRETWPFAVMVKELARGWTPERAEEFRLKDKAERSARIGLQPTRKNPMIKAVKR